MVRTELVDVGEVVLGVRRWSGPEEPARPPLVLLAGTGMTASDWDVVAPGLATRREVRAVDLRGHGASSRPGRYSISLMADDVVALLDRVPAPRVDLGGHSLGGLVALRVAAARPDRVRRLVLEDVGLLRPRTPSPPERPDGSLEFDWAVVEQVRPEVDAPDPGWRRLARSVTTPTLVVGGGPTSSVPQEALADLVAALPDARLVTLDTGHLVHAGDPRGFIDVVAPFLDAMMTS